MSLYFYESICSTFVFLQLFSFCSVLSSQSQHNRHQRRVAARLAVVTNSQNVSQTWPHISLKAVHILLRNRKYDLPMGPTGFLGLNSAVKQTLVLKHVSLRPLMLHCLLKMLILFGLNEALTVTFATPRDLKRMCNFKNVISFTSSNMMDASLLTHTVVDLLTRAAPLCHRPRLRRLGLCHHSDLWRYLGTFQNTATEDPVWSQGSSEKVEINQNFHMKDKTFIGVNLTEKKLNHCFSCVPVRTVCLMSSCLHCRCKSRPFVCPPVVLQL